MEDRRGTNREIVLIEWLALSPLNRAVIRLMIQIRYLTALQKRKRCFIVVGILFAVYGILNIQFGNSF